MRAILGLLLIMLGLAMAVVWMPEHDGQRQLAAVTDIATKGLPRTAAVAPVVDDRNTRTFSPHTPLLVTVDPVGSRNTTYTAATARIVSPVPPGSTPTSEPARQTVAATVTPPTSASTSVVTGSMVAAALLAPVTNTAGQRAAPLQPASKHELVRDLQRELKRVGCYAGDVDGDWGTGSRRAMTAFTDRVNASLPVEQPDFILLTLLKGHSGTACGKDCPAGQSISGSGRCLPDAVVAQSARRGNERRGTNRDFQAEADRRDALALSSQNQTAANVQVTTSIRRESVESGRATDGATTAAAGLSVAAATAAGAIPASPSYPGRMAMGGPQGGAYVNQPADRMLAQDTVRGAANQEPALDSTPFAPSRAAPRERSRSNARRVRSSAYAYRYSPAPLFAYRAPRFIAPRYYASAPRRVGRSWTGSFFGAN